MQKMPSSLKNKMSSTDASPGKTIWEARSPPCSWAALPGRLCCSRIALGSGEPRLCQAPLRLTPARNCVARVGLPLQGVRHPLLPLCPGYEGKP